MTEPTKLDRNILTIINIETTSRGSFNRAFCKQLQDGGQWRFFGRWENTKLGLVETKTLICLWAEEDIQRQLASMGRKKNIWEGIAMKLQESGYSRSGDQCKTRMHILQQKYKKVKTLNNTSGQGKNSFPFYEEIDKVLGHKPSINPLSTLSSAAGGLSSSSDNTLDALETESVLSSVDGLDEENFFV